MQLLVHITNHENVVDPIMIKLAKAGFHGASVVDCEGMLKSLNQDSVDAPTIFGGLRQFVNPGRQQNKMILVVLKDEEIQAKTRRQPYICCIISNGILIFQESRNMITK